MTPRDFPEANQTINPPPDAAEGTVEPVRGFVGCESGGGLDGAVVVTVAWQPSDEERAAILHGAPIFLTCIGGLPPHYLTTYFPHNVLPSPQG